MKITDLIAEWRENNFRPTLDELLEVEKEQPKKIMEVTDAEGINHAVYGDDFVHMALTDALQKLGELEMLAAQAKGHDA